MVVDGRCLPLRVLPTVRVWHLVAINSLALVPIHILQHSLKTLNTMSSHKTSESMVVRPRLKSFTTLAIPRASLNVLPVQKMWRTNNLDCLLQLFQLFVQRIMGNSQTTHKPPTNGTLQVVSLQMMESGVHRNGTIDEPSPGPYLNSWRLGTPKQQ